MSSKNTGILFVFLSLVLACAFLIFRNGIYNLLAAYFSPDQTLTSTGKREFFLAYFFGVGVLLVIGFALQKAQNTAWRRKIKTVFFSDPLHRPVSFWPSPRVTLVLSTLMGLFLIINMRIWSGVPSVFQFFYAKDHGALDLFVPITMFVSAVLLLITVWRLWTRYPSTKSRLLLVGAYVLMGGLLIIYAGEETNWGQTFFGWQTPAAFAGNLENETNIHNYFNNFFDYGYIALSLVLVVMLISVWMNLGQRWLPVSRLLLPHPSLIGLSLLIAFIAIVWYQEQEMLEEMVAVFVFFYAFRIFNGLRTNPALNLNMTPEISTRLPHRRGDRKPR